MPTSLEVWQDFFNRSLAARLETETFTSYVCMLSAKHPLSSARICDLFLTPSYGDNSCCDPRTVRYVQCLLSEKLIEIPDILRALWKTSSFRTLADDHNGVGEGTQENGVDKEEGKGSRIWTNSYSTEETIFYRLAKQISSGTSPKDSQETAKLIRACVHWMGLVTSIPHTTTAMLLPTQTQEVTLQHMALGTLLVAMVENSKIQQAISKGSIPKSKVKELEISLGLFIAILVQSSPQSAARLEMFRTETLAQILPADLKQRQVEDAARSGTEKEINELLGGSLGLGLTSGLDAMVVEDPPSLNTRAGLYVYLNSLLVGRPLIDDNSILNYLHNRYQGDVRQTIIDLVLATFDVLANATFRNEKSQSKYIFRTFLINKIPLLLATLSPSLFPPLTSEYCITEALGHVDTTAFPTLSNIFDDSSANSNMFPDSVRQDFCFSCCLHGLIDESSIEELLGEIPMQNLPAGGRYVKEDLVQQCLSDPERAEGLINELEQMDGNVGAVSQALTEVIARLCSNKETMSLKTLCSQLVRKPSSLDVMLLFDKPVTILQPMCDLLDNWRYDEDQGEYQPVYEEFGSILLLVLSFTYRYNLSPTDLGIHARNSFVLKLLNQGHLSRAMDELNEQEQKHLDGWIIGLFDNESGGLGDELMSSCPPQDFYLLVPTLFHHIVLACSTKHLSDDTLRCGLEYLVDTFLLPSLIPGITWLSSHLWESRGDANAVLQILSALITSPASISNNTEASQMLNSILNVIGKNLEQSLRWLQRAEPSRQDVEPLSKVLRGNLGWERKGASDHTELEAWTKYQRNSNREATETSSSHPAGLRIATKETFINLVQWGINPGVDVNPASYTHRQILVGVKILGAKNVLLTLIEEVKAQIELGNSAVAFDVAAAIVAAPDSASSEPDMLGLQTGQPLQRRMALREALKNEAEDAPKLHHSDPVQAETVIRLYRKVEAHLNMPQMNMPQIVNGLDGGLQGALEDAGVDVGGMGDLSGMDGTGTESLGMSASGMGLDMGDHGDLIQGLLGGGDGGVDLLVDFGDDGGLGDSMVF